MTTPNERELAQLERGVDPASGPDETALILVEVVGRRESGPISQYRILSEPTTAEVRAWLEQQEQTP